MTEIPKEKSIPIIQKFLCTSKEGCEYIITIEKGEYIVEIGDWFELYNSRGILLKKYNVRTIDIVYYEKSVKN